MARQQITISNEQDRLTVAAILVKNGYCVRQVRVKASQTGKTMKTVVEHWEEEK